MSYWSITDRICQDLGPWLRVETYLSSICLALLSTTDLFSSTCIMRFSNSHCWSCRALLICTTLNIGEITTFTRQKIHLILRAWKMPELHFLPLRTRHYAADLRGVTENKSTWILNRCSAKDSACRDKSDRVSCCSEEVFNLWLALLCIALVLCVCRQTCGFCGRTADSCCSTEGHMTHKTAPRAPVCENGTWAWSKDTTLSLKDRRWVVREEREERERGERAWSISNSRQTFHSHGPRRSISVEMESGERLEMVNWHKLTGNLSRVRVNSY